MVGEHSDGNRCEWKGNERFGAGGVHSCELRYLAGKNGKWGPRIESMNVSPIMMIFQPTYVIVYQRESKFKNPLRKGAFGAELPPRFAKANLSSCVFGGKIPWRLLKWDTS